ncbi:MAG: hypothetical protein E5V59_08675 [Mesorhizobium sp.]|nr:MAG: hypothetical protein E5V59_08675 [Mesorhizobium sp.]
MCRAARSTDSKIFVVYRGSDLSGDLTDIIIPFLFGATEAANVPAGLADPLDWGNNGALTLGTLAHTQLDDALRLLQFAKALPGDKQVVVTGQSLGGGLATLAVAVENARETFLPGGSTADLVDGFAIVARRSITSCTSRPLALRSRRLASARMS